MQAVRQPIVDDVTRLNPVPVWAVATPTTIEEIQGRVIRRRTPRSFGRFWVPRRCVTRSWRPF
jgi:hypothetical protein